MALLQTAFISVVPVSKKVLGSSCLPFVLSASRDRQEIAYLLAELSDLRLPGLVGEHLVQLVPALGLAIVFGFPDVSEEAIMIILRAQVPEQDVGVRCARASLEGEDAKAEEPLDHRDSSAVVRFRYSGVGCSIIRCLFLFLQFGRCAWVFVGHLFQVFDSVKVY